MPYILIQVIEGIANFLMAEGHLNKVMEFKCNIYIIMAYLHSPSNIKIFFRYLILRQYIMKFMFSRLFIHLTISFNIYKNEHNEKLVTLMVKGFRV
jgi:hypothetical protein